ncbi:uncharacterized protein LOC110825900 [Carica papaya]|uniref:uncharacterized protein LOC110825900 n=1 Tax=Carica papaya TaxID=3649 RepID=UPI000B8CA595|nr:uncharacterized protein LOC110825900 [Carica papaya]
MRTTKNQKLSLRRTQRRRRTRRVVAHARAACRPRTCSKLSHKLRALKNLIPAQNDVAGGENVRAEKLFEETADYIILLRTQVVVLQRLIEFYGSGADDQKQNAAAFCH